MFKKLLVLFLGICIPLRFAITFIAKILPIKYLPIMGVLFLIFGCAFLYQFVSQTRMTGILGQYAWWSDLRAVHGFLFILFAILAFMRYRDAWKILFLDTSFGLVAFFIYHIGNGHFQKLLNS